MVNNKKPGRPPTPKKSQLLPPQVTTVAQWYRTGLFNSEEEARGAFRLAHQQGLDGMGTGVSAWMGLNEQEYDSWMRDDSLPPKR